MFYHSTRGGGGKVSAAAAIAKGLSDDGGLFVPESFPRISHKEMENLSLLPYNERAAGILGLFLDDYSADELQRFAKEAYSLPGFDNPAIAPLYKLNSGTHFLELWHGPTSAFKDMALQMLPRLLSAALIKTDEKREVCILVATS